MNSKIKEKEINQENTIKNFLFLSEETNKTKMSVLKDMLHCKRKYDCTFQDYFLFEMNALNHLERHSIVSKKVNNKYIQKYNISKFLPYFLEKEKFYQTFSKYINREWMPLTGKNKREFATFCEKHPIITGVSSKGKNTYYVKYDTSKYKLKDLYDELIENHQTMIEEEIDEYSSLKKLYPDSLNTIYIVSLLGTIVVGYLLIGNNHKSSSDYCYGGLFAPIELETGIVTNPAIDYQKISYEKHPITGVKILDFKVPKWKEIKKMIEEACLEVPQIGYVGWTFAVEKEKVLLIKATPYPDYRYYSHPNNKVGLLSKFHEAEERKFEE